MLFPYMSLKIPSSCSWLWALEEDTNCEKARVGVEDSFPLEMRLKIHFNASLIVMYW